MQKHRHDSSTVKEGGKERKVYLYSAYRQHPDH